MRTRSASLLIGAAAGCIALAAFATPATAQDAGNLTPEAAAKLYPDKLLYSRYAGRDFPTRPFFGDTHLHAAFSMDAGAFGAQLGPRDAYRFARGEQVISSSGQPAKLSRPLDFLVVADHSDNMGFFPDLTAGKPELPADPSGDLDQHDRRAGTDRGVDRSAVRSCAARLLLRPRYRNPDAALDRLRRQFLRNKAVAGYADDDPGTRPYVIHLVHAEAVTAVPGHHH